MPSKRQPSKQRRAAQNRARSAALAARSQNANQPAPSVSARSSGGAKSSRAEAATPARRPGLLGGLLNPGGGGAGARQQVALSGDLEGNPGRSALFMALALAIGVGIAALFFPVTVDDRGDPVPATGFGGLYLRAREALGGSVETSSKTALDASGGVVIIGMLIPVAIAAGAIFVYYRRRANRQSVYWPLTIAMIVMALAVMFLQITSALPSLIALAIAGFQVRKAEMQAGIMAAGGGTVAASAEEDEYEDDDSEYEDDDEYDEYEDEDLEDEDLEDDEYVDEDVEYEAEDEVDEDLEVEGEDEVDEDVEEPEAPKKR